jgi:pectate lyase
MKLTASLLMLVASAISASPTLAVKGRASNALQNETIITDAANIGFATMNGG